MSYDKKELDRINREEHFKKRLKEANPKLELTSKYLNMHTKVEYKCLECGTENQIAFPQALIRNDNGCAICDCKRKMLVGYNDFATTHPQLVCAFKNKEEAKTVKSCSRAKLDFKCPICGHERKIRVADFATYGFSCPRCGDGYSYPSRFMFNLLEQLNIDFEDEKQFEWLPNRRYDFVFDDIIIEMDGGFHKGSTYRSYEESKKIDDLKDKKAVENGYKIIRIECYKSDFEYIKRNILSSELSNILKTDSINWVELEKELITNNMVKKASELFNEYKGVKNLLEIAEMMNVRQAKLCSLLKTSARIGMTDYSSDMARSGRYTPNKPKSGSKKCICLETQKVYDSCAEAEEDFGLRRDAIARVCRGERLTVRDYHFDFIETTKEIQDKKEKMKINKSKPSHNMKKVLCVETGVIYDSSADASRAMGMNPTYITGIIHDKRKAKNGNTFKYI